MTDYNITKNLTTNTIENILPFSSLNKKLADGFVNLFVDKIKKMRTQFRHEDTYNIPTRNCNILSQLQTII